MPIVFLEINSLITFFLQNPSSSAVGIRTVDIGCSAVDSYPIPVFWHRARPPNMDTHSFGPKKYQKKGQKNRKKGEKSCQEYQWYINYWPPCPGFGPKNGQKKTQTNLKTTYSKNHDGHINYLPTSFTKKKNIRHPRFPRGPPPQYWSGPMVLNFAVRMRCGVSTMVWSNDGIYVFVMYADQKTKKLVN